MLETEPHSEMAVAGHRLRVMRTDRSRRDSAKTTPNRTPPIPRPVPTPASLADMARHNQPQDSSE